MKVTVEKKMTVTATKMKVLGKQIVRGTKVKFQVTQTVVLTVKVIVMKETLIN